MASERESIEERRCAMPAARSWYVEFGCTMERNALGSNDFDEMEIAAPGVELKGGTVVRQSVKNGMEGRTGLHIHRFEAVLNSADGTI